MRRKAVYLATISIVATFILVNAVYPSTTDYRNTNSLWNGYSEAISITNAHLITSAFEERVHNLNRETSILILIPYTPLSDRELEALRSYLIQGGMTILLDDYGYGNSILEYLGIGIRFKDNGTLVDPLFYHRNGRIPRIIWLDQSSPYLINISELYFDHGVSLEVYGTTHILANSSSFSFFDENGNYVWDEDEYKGPQPVIVEVEYGRGELIIIGDPSIWINSVIRMGDNRDLLLNLISSREVFIDQSHLIISIHDIIQLSIMDIYIFLSRRNITSILALAIVSLIVFRYRR